MTQQAFSEALGVHKQTVVDVEGRRKGYADRIPFSLAKKIALLTGAEVSTLVNQSGVAMAYGGRGPYSAADWLAWIEGCEFASDSGVAQKTLNAVASAMLAAEKLGGRQALFLSAEIEEVFMRHVAAFGIRNAPAGAFSPDLRNEEAARSGPALDIGGRMMNLRAGLRTLGRRVDLKTLECLNPAILLKLASGQITGAAVLDLITGARKTLRELLPDGKGTSGATAKKRVKKVSDKGTYRAPAKKISRKKPS
jgi:DNA-binding XRE family transcriptional regulator